MELFFSTAKILCHFLPSHFHIVWTQTANFFHFSDEQTSQTKFVICSQLIQSTPITVNPFWLRAKCICAVVHQAISPDSFTGNYFPYCIEREIIQWDAHKNVSWSTRVNAVLRKTAFVWPFCIRPNKLTVTLCFIVFVTYCTCHTCRRKEFSPFVFFSFMV